MFLIRAVVLGCVGCLATLGLEAAPRAGAPSPEKLQALLKLYPAADADRDGTLTLAEAQAYRKPLTAARGTRAPGEQNAPDPTRRDVSYGASARHVFDFWQASTNKPTPLVIFIHGGGFVGGDKSGVSARAIRQCLDEGVSYASINYRFRKDAPIQDILRDAARAVQYLRLHAAEFGIDPARIACYGGSAGAGTSLWLATRDDLADPASADPVLRQSTRLLAAACLNGQATYDLTQWDALVGPFRTEWKSGPDEEVQFYHFASRGDLATDAGRRVLAECDMLRWVSKDDPPLFLSCSVADAEPADRGAYVHHPRHAKAVKARCDTVGEPCDIALGAGGGDQAALSFLLRHLLGRS